MHKPSFPAATFAGATLAVLMLASSAQAARLHTTRSDGSGDSVSATAVARQGANGGVLRGRAVTTTAQGSSAVSGAVVHGANGAVARRAGATTVNADGSATHQSGFSASSSKGSAQSSGSASRDASGDLTQNRSSSATSAATGNSVQSSSSYSSAAGLTHSATCFNASGAVIACR